MLDGMPLPDARDREADPAAEMGLKTLEARPISGG